jgi:D-serine dehydratase
VLNLGSITGGTLPAGTKGLPPDAAGGVLRDLGSRGYNVLAGDIPLPACVLSREAISHNRAVMREFTRRMGVRLAPHGKSTMAPQLFAEQLDDDAWAMTAATPAHLFAYRSVNVSRILYANQLVDPIAIAFVLDELERDPAFEFMCLVDSIAGINILLDAMATRRPARPLDVLIEFGVPGARTGVRGGEQALLLAQHIASAGPFLRLRGIEAFEGVVAVGTEAGVNAVTQLLDDVSRTAAALAAGNLFHALAPIISVGGSAYFGLVAQYLRAQPLRTEIVLRSGCYLTNDHGMYACAQALETSQGRLTLEAPFKPAIEVWAHVQSRPEPGLAFLTLGKRDISHDMEMPIPIKWVRRGKREIVELGPEFRIDRLNDQHARLLLPESHPLEVGDLVALGCSHPCTTFDKWRTLLMVDSSYNVIDAISTLF